MTHGRTLEYLHESWGWIALRGLVAVLFGLLAMAWPGITLVALVLLWGAYALVDGVLALIAAFRIRDRGRPTWPFAVIGVLGIAAGVVTFVMPDITARVLLAVIALWALLMGAFQVVAAIRLRKDIDHEWLLAFSGVLSLAFGVLALARPGAGALALILTIAIYSMAFGITLILLGFRLRGYHGRPVRA